MGYIVLNSKFKPFSYQEMLAPIMQAQEEHNKIEEELGNLDIMASDIAAKLTNNPEDKELRDLYNSFNVELNKASDELSTRGLNPQTRKNLIALKAQYAEKLNPINEAYKAYVEDQKYLDRLAIEHPEIIVEGAGKSISDYMYGKTPQMRSVNTDDLMNQAMVMAKTQAGRTYKQSGWTSTAGGKFLERSTEIGLNDVDFNNALALIEDNKLTANDFGMTDEQFAKVKHNASLINDSLVDLVDSPDFEKLSDSNKRKAMNSIIKGVRAGFQYDRKVETESNPMFAYNLKQREEALKAALEKEQRRKVLGSSRFIMSNNEISQIRASYLGKDGKLHSGYSKYFDETGKLKPKNTDDKLGPITTSYLRQFNDSLYNDAYYDKFVKDISLLGFDPSTVTREQLENTLKQGADAIGRERSRIISDSEGFNVIKRNIMSGFKNTEGFEEIVGWENANSESLNTNRRYKTAAKKVSYEDLVGKGKSIDDLDIVDVNLDRSTGQVTFSAKDARGQVREFLMPMNSMFNGMTDVEDLERTATTLNIAKRNANHGVVINSEGKEESIGDPYRTIHTFASGFKGTYMEYEEYLNNLMSDIFLDSLNYLGKLNVNK